jgi:hypothetical protein
MLTRSRYNSFQLYVSGPIESAPLKREMQRRMAVVAPGDPRFRATHRVGSTVETFHVTSRTASTTCAPGAARTPCWSTLRHIVDLALPDVPGVVVEQAEQVRRRLVPDRFC